MERERKAKSGEPALSAKTVQDGIAAIKMLLYNKAVISAICGEESGRQSKNAEQALTDMHACVDTRLSEMGKTIKLMEYASTIGGQKLTRCEMKSRDYNNEFRFAPYEFLRGSDGPKLFNHKIFNECILSDSN